MPLFASVYRCLVVICWERADLLALVCGVLLLVCYFPISILSQVRYLIVSIPDLCTLSYFAISLKKKRELVASLLLSYGCLVTVYAPCLFLTVPWVGLQCVIVVFPDHTHLLFGLLVWLWMQRSGPKITVCAVFDISADISDLPTHLDPLLIKNYNL